MKIRYVSDLHLEICPFVLPHDDDGDESDQVLVLAGDIAVAKRFTPTMFAFFNNVANRFRYVIYVPGNHEYYDGDIVDAVDVIKDQLASMHNVHVLQEDVFWVDEFAFIGATLWTDVHNRSESAMHTIKNGLNDYHVIRVNYYKDLEPLDTAIIHDRHREFIFDNVKKAKDEGASKVIVISHHAPSYLSIHPKWAGHSLNAAFSSDLFDRIKEDGPDIWFHGHMHDNFDYEIGSTRIICNPRGYSRIINSSEFNVIWQKSKDNQTISVDPYVFWNMFEQENSKFSPWASVEV